MEVWIDCLVAQFYYGRESGQLIETLRPTSRLNLLAGCRKNLPSDKQPSTKIDLNIKSQEKVIKPSV